MLAGQRGDLQSRRGYLLGAPWPSRRRKPPISQEPGHLAGQSWTGGLLTSGTIWPAPSSTSRRRARDPREGKGAGRASIWRRSSARAGPGGRSGAATWARRRTTCQRGLAITEQRAPRGLRPARILTGLEGIVARASRATWPSAEAFHQARAGRSGPKHWAGDGNRARRRSRCTSLARGSSRRARPRRLTAHGVCLVLRALDRRWRRSSARLGGTHKDPGFGFAATHDAYYHDAAVALVWSAGRRRLLHSLSSSAPGRARSSLCSPSATSSSRPTCRSN